jgi:hypothetical protein
LTAFAIGKPLSAQRERAVAGVAQAHVGIARETEPAAQPPRVDVEAAFQAEDRRGAAAQVLAAAHAPTAAGRHARGKLLQVVALHVADEVDTVLDDAVERDAALRMRAGGRGQRQREQDSLHCG